MFKNAKDNTILNGKVKRYLLYALGEIILVVIGILIALGVNNRNIASVEKQQEIKILKELNEGFISDSLNLTYFGQRIRFNTYAVGHILDVLQSDQAYHDSLDAYFAMAVTPFMWSESNSAYKTLLSKGVDVISNDTIRNDIISIHTNLFETIKYLDDGVFVKHGYIHEYCLKHFDRVGSEAIGRDNNFTAGRMKPLNYQALKSDQEYLTILRTVKSQQEVFLSILNSTKQQLALTIKRIESEINQS